MGIHTGLFLSWERWPPGVLSSPWGSQATSRDSSELTIWYWISCMQHRITYSCDSSPLLVMALLSWQLHGDALMFSYMAIHCLLSNVAQVCPRVRESPCWRMEGERKSEREDERSQRLITAELEWTGLFVVCPHRNLSAHPLCLVLCRSQAQFQVSECARVCQIENESEKEEKKRWIEKGSGQPAWFSQTLNSRLWSCVLTLQTIDSDSVCFPPSSCKA